MVYGRFHTVKQLVGKIRVLNEILLHWKTGYCRMTISGTRVDTIENNKMTRVATLRIEHINCQIARFCILGKW